MSESVARAVGAEGDIQTTIAGKVCTVRALGIRELAEVERICLRQYRRSFMEAHSENMDFLPPDQAQAIIEKKLEQCAQWDIDDLPSKFAYDPSRILIGSDLLSLVEGFFGEQDKNDEEKMQRLVATMLDQGVLSDDVYKDVTGFSPVKQKVPYVNWWITGAFEGMIVFVWTAFKHNGVTREEVAGELGSNPMLLSELAREIERLSAPQTKNG